MAGRPLNPIELDAYDVLPRDLASRVRVHQIRGLPGGYAGMTLGHHVLVARPVPSDGSSTLLAHELVHVRQWSDRGTLRFGASYVTSFARNLIRHRHWDRAYRAIDAEEEARREATDWARRRARDAAIDRTGAATDQTAEPDDHDPGRRQG